MRAHPLLGAVVLAAAQGRKNRGAMHRYAPAGASAMRSKPVEENVGRKG